MIDLRWTSDLQKISYEEYKNIGMIRSQNCKIAWESVHKLAYNIPKWNFSMF